MKENQLQLPDVTKDEVFASEFLENHPVMDFQLNGYRGQLRLTPFRVLARLHHPPASFESEAGSLSLYNAEPLLSLISGCPALLENIDAPQNPWYWDLYNHHLSPEIAAAFGYLRPGKKSGEKLLFCQITVAVAGEKAVGFISLTPLTLTELFRRGQWNYAPPERNLTLAITLPLLLAATSLPPETLLSLRPGDILLPEKGYFNPSGVGKLKVGNLWLYLQPLTSSPLSFTVTNEVEDMEATEYDDLSPEEFIETDRGAIADRAERLPTPGRLTDLASVPLKVTLRAGTTSLPLKRLQQLGTGSILTFSDCTPGHATLYYEDRPLAQGELIDIEGNLGFRIIRMEIL